MKGSAVELLLKQRIAFMEDEEIKNFSKKPAIITMILVVIFILAAWIFTGFVIVPSGERAVVQTFGKYQRTLKPGIYWVPHIINSSTVFNIEKIEFLSFPAELITKDENLIMVSTKIGYRISNPRGFMFSASEPLEALKNISMSAASRLAGGISSGDLLASAWENNSKLDAQLLSNIDVKGFEKNYGLQITSAALEKIHPAAGLAESFMSIMRANETTKNIIGAANAYREKKLKKARIDADDLLAKAEVYKGQAVLEAKAKSDEFSGLLAAYKKAPQVTQNRLYLDAVDQILSENKVVLLDVKGNNIVRLSFEKPAEVIVSDEKTPSEGAAKHSELISGGREPRPAAVKRIGYPKGGTANEKN